MDSKNVEEKEKLKSTPEEKKSDPKKNKSLWSSKPLMGSIAVYCIWSLHDMAYSEVCTSMLVN